MYENAKNIKELSLIKTAFETYKDRILSLRNAAWTVPSRVELVQKVFPNGFLDELDATAHNWIVKTDEGAIVGAARLTVHFDFETIPFTNILIMAPLELLQFPIAILGRLVVHPEYQNKGISKILDRIREEKARTLKCRTIAGITTHSSRPNQFQKNGYEVFSIGGQFSFSNPSEIKVHCKGVSLQPIG